MPKLDNNSMQPQSPSPTREAVSETAQRLAEVLRREDVRIVFAESCTAGSAAAELGRVPGISEFFCGSAVVYRDMTKTEWLNVDPDDICKKSSVSETVAAQLARNVLLQTPEADVSASITGHLGPDAPADKDGIIFIGLAWRAQGKVQVYHVAMRSLAERDRLPRRSEAVHLLFTHLSECIHATRRHRLESIKNESLVRL